MVSLSTNTMISREMVEHFPNGKEVESSGKPQGKKIHKLLPHFPSRVKGEIPIIGCGGIDSVEPKENRCRCGITDNFILV